ncbi:hypothetical protein [Streptomyces sp. V1I6]|nr:hypothetical protein [Streptomyces sp. V1I6]MDQ0841238.1 phosphoribosylcarboxyaminoimidazole (NCAIR) mutase [Streptomyces sp. V1I6]
MKPDLAALGAGPAAALPTRAGARTQVPVPAVVGVRTGRNT